MDRQRLEEQLISDEGVVFKIYKDHLGFATFGVGHLILKSDPEYKQPVGTPVSEERVWEAFHSDVNNAIDETRILLGDHHDELPGEVKEILVNMVFQMGRPRVSRFVNMLGAIKKHDWKSAANHGRDSLWWREQTRNRAERLMSRLEKV